MNELLRFENLNGSQLWDATKDTLIMMGWSMLFTTILGLVLGVVLFLTSRKQLLDQPVVYGVLSVIVNILRSVPFIILLIALLPFTKLVVGTTLGVEGSIPPLVVAAVPFFARLVEISLREVDKGVIEAAQAMGASKLDIVWRVLLLEARPGLIAGVTITAVALVSYTALSGVVGGGGLGDYAIRNGYQRFQPDVMVVTVGVLVVMVQLLQSIGDLFVRRFSRK